MLPTFARVLSSSCTEIAAWAPQDAYGGGPLDADRSILEFAILPVVLVAIVVFGLLGRSWIQASARVQEKRLELIRELAAAGKLDARAFEAQLNPRRRLMTAIFVIAWFMLLGGASLVIVNWLDGWNPYDDEGPAGIALVVAAVAILTAPMALREMRRHAA